MSWDPVYVDRTTLAHFILGDGFDADRVAEDGTELDQACSSASRAVDGWCRRQFGQLAAPEARTYTLEWSVTAGMWYAEVDDFTTTVGMVLKFDSACDGTYATTVPTTAAVLDPPNALAKGKPYERVYLRTSSGVTLDGRKLGFQATLRYGWFATFPDQVVYASKLQGSRFFARRNSPYGVAGSPQDGSEIRLSSRLDPDLRSALRGLRRTRWAA